MKKIFTFLILSLPSFIFAQLSYDYEITVIDSFQCYATNQAGMAALSAVEFNGDIHLSYMMQDTTTAQKVMYSIRRENGIDTEFVADLPDNTILSSAPSTALQFDADGNPHIYASYMVQTGQRSVFAYHKNGNEWQGGFVTNTGYWPYLVADPDGSNGMGFAFWSPNSTFGGGQITFASFIGDTWEFDHLSSNVDLPRTKPSTVNYNNKTYVAYGEGHCLDTLITRVYVRENNEWSMDYEDVHLTTYNCGGINGLSTKLGKSDQGVYLLTGLRTENGHPYFVKNEGFGWQPQTVNYDASLTAFGWQAPNLEVNNDNTVFWINEDNASNPNLSWITSEGEGGIIDLPHYYYALWLHDFIIKNNTAYIYYWEGAAGWPYGYPVTFKEVKIGLDQFLTSDYEIPSPLNFTLHQNYPNPFEVQTSIRFELQEASGVSLKVYDLSFRNITEVFNITSLSQGTYEYTIDATGLNSGFYFYVLKVNGQALIRKMEVAK